MEKDSKTGIIGAVLIGLGVGLTAAGIVLVIPPIANWSFRRAGEAFETGRERVVEAAAALGEVAGRAQHHFGEAAKAAKKKTSKAAGAVETAARHVREFTASASD